MRFRATPGIRRTNSLKTFRATNSFKFVSLFQLVRTGSGVSTSQNNMAFQRTTLSVLFITALFATHALSAPIPHLASRATNAKRGIAYDMATKPSLTLAANSAISWEYNWAVAPPEGLPSGITHVPMQWGSSGIVSFQSQVQKQGAKYVLGFNEPDMSSQSNMAATDAAALYKQYMAPLRAAGIKVGAPAISSAPAGLTWLQTFIANCDEFDFLPIHWYGEGGEGGVNFLNYVESVHQTTGGKWPLWVTEYADTTMNDASTVQSFLTASIAKLDSLSYVDRYSWFDYASQPVSGLQSNLITGSTLNSLGKAYIS
jgi:hypothetical protein